MWTCQKCNETNEDSFEACWNCGTSKAGEEDPSFRKADDVQLDDQRWAQPPSEAGSGAADTTGPKRVGDVPTHLEEAILVTLCC